MDKQVNTPKLRFPEFEGTWLKKCLGDVGEVKMCKRIFNEETLPIGDIPFYKIGSFGKLADAFISKELYSEYRNRFSFPKKGDILISAAGTIGRTVVYDGEDAYYQDSNIVWIDNDNSTVLNEFLYYIFQIVKYKTEGGTIQRLYNSILRSTKFVSPTISEQSKIANFLTDVDNKLTQQKKKNSLLEQYKKGVMQQLFSQELRFKDEDGNDYPDWEEKSLGEISDNIMYGMNAAAIPFDGVNKYIRITDIEEKSCRFLPNPLTSPDGVIEEKYKLKEGDILFARTGASVGKSYLYKVIDGNLLFAGFLIKFSIIKANPSFIFQQTKLESYNKWVQTMSMRSGQPGINAEEYKTLMILLPSLPEQAKIASFLFALDDKIAQTALQIEKMQLWKKGLLQQMFV